jgi:hypothetical protein
MISELPVIESRVMILDSVNYFELSGGIQGEVFGNIAVSNSEFCRMEFD